MVDEELSKALEWVNNLLYYACASNRHELLKQYTVHLPVLVSRLAKLGSM